MITHVGNITFCLQTAGVYLYFLSFYLDGNRRAFSHRDLGCSSYSAFSPPSSHRDPSSAATPLCEGLSSPVEINSALRVWSFTDTVRSVKDHRAGSCMICFFLTSGKVVCVCVLVQIVFDITAADYEQ